MEQVVRVSASVADNVRALADVIIVPGCAADDFSDKVKGAKLRDALKRFDYFYLQESASQGKPTEHASLFAAVETVAKKASARGDLPAFGDINSATVPDLRAAVQCMSAWYTKQRTWQEASVAALTAFLGKCCEPLDLSRDMENGFNPSVVQEWQSAGSLKGELHHLLQILESEIKEAEDHQVVLKKVIDTQYPNTIPGGNSLRIDLVAVANYPQKEAKDSEKLFTLANNFLQSFPVDFFSVAAKEGLQAMLKFFSDGRLVKAAIAVRSWPRDSRWARGLSVLFSDVMLSTGDVEWQARCRLETHIVGGDQAAQESAARAEALYAFAEANANRLDRLEHLIKEVTQHADDEIRELGNSSSEKINGLGNIFDQTITELRNSFGETIKTERESMCGKLESQAAETRKQIRAVTTRCGQVESGAAETRERIRGVSEEAQEADRDIAERLEALRHTTEVSANATQSALESLASRSASLEQRAPAVDEHLRTHASTVLAPITALQEELLRQARNIKPLLARRQDGTSSQDTKDSADASEESACCM